MSTNFPTSIDTFPSQATLATHTLATDKHSNLHANATDAVAALEAKVGVNSSAVTTSIDYKLAKLANSKFYNVQLGIPGVINPILPSNSAATNTSNLQTLLNLAAFGSSQSLYFPSGTYQLNAITMSYTGQRLVGSNNTDTILEYHGSGAGNAFITIAGTDTGDYSGRTRNSGLEDIALGNAGTSDSIAVKITSGTHHHFRRAFFYAWHRNAIYASDFADTTFWECEYEDCGSMDDSDKAVIDFNGTATEWAVDQVTFVRNRFETCGDQILKAVDGNGHYVGKIHFLACKAESGGNMGGTDSQFYLSNAEVIFSGCEFTLQDMRAAHATIPACIHMAGTSSVYMDNCQWHLGGGSTKLFTYLVDIDAADSTLTQTNIIVDSEMSSSSFFPTHIVRAQNTPTAAFSVCVYKGGGKSHAPTWLTGAVQSADVAF